MFSVCIGVMGEVWFSFFYYVSFFMLVCYTHVFPESFSGSVSIYLSLIWLYFYFIPVFLKVKIMYASLLLNKLIEHQSMDVTVP